MFPPQKPSRLSIHDQIVQILRDGIHGQRWQTVLPTEMELCRELQVSRMTLRKALKQLADETYISLGGRGNRHLILNNNPKIKASPSEAKTIRVLTPFVEFGSTLHHFYMTLSERLSSRGFRIALECHPRLYSKFSSRRLEQLNALPDTAAWVLMFTNKRQQQWFATNGLPCIVMGRIYDEIKMSNIILDSVASSRHAAGLLHSKGHVHMVYAIAKLTSLGDQMSADSFIDTAKKLNCHARIISYEASSEVDIKKAIGEIISSRPRPTAIITGDPDIAITFLCYLQASGFKIPKDFSIISSGDDYHLKSTYPAIACYKVDERTYGSKAASMLVDLIQNGPRKIRTHVMMPEYCPGGSVDIAPSQASK
jgi:DNA-binding LacI/PurR family transcriptional regulator